MAEPPPVGEPVPGPNTGPGGGAKPSFPQWLRFVLFAAVVAVAGALVVRGLVFQRSACPAVSACGPEVASLASLEEASQDAEFVFLLFPGDAGVLANAVAGRVEKVAEAQRGRGKSVAVFSMKSGTPDFHRLVKIFAPKEFPLVLVAGKGCGSLPLAGDVSEEDLARAFADVSSRKSACCPRPAKTLPAK